jgi:hypothetical protein
MTNKAEVIKVLRAIAQDMKNDAKNFDGKPFTGRTVAEYFGNQGAAIAALAHIIETLIVEEESK